jgi:7-cyano-7-deazaguanine reductase
MKTKPAKKCSQPALTLLGQSHTKVPDSPDQAVLEAFPNPNPGRAYWITLDCPEFTALCPITGQPDFGHLAIRYIPGKWCVESKALKIYLFSYRNTGAFHEAVVNRIMDDLVRAIKPRKMVVTGNFNRRGGIAITVEASYP